MVSKFKKVHDSELGLFAIFDGHLGHDVADYLQCHLFENILNEVPCCSSHFPHLFPFILINKFIPFLPGCSLISGQKQRMLLGKPIKLLITRF